MNEFFRSDLADLPTYVAGKNPADPDVIKVASNELPFPTLSGVAAAIAGHMGEASRYPDIANSRLRSAIAAYHQVGVNNVAVGNGSTALIEDFLSGVCAPDSQVIIPWRSFEAYPIAVQVAGGQAVKVALNRAGEPDLPAMLDAVTDATRAILLCTPNNPSSAALRHADLRRFLQQVPAHIPVLIDEAYQDFVVMDDPVRGLELVSEFPNVVTLRTFSKAYGLAALRIGYAIGAAEIIEGLTAVATPFGVNTVAQVAGVAALQQRGEVDRRVQIITRERENLVRALRSLGWDGPQPQGNFLWFATGSQTQLFAELCLEEKIVVRAFGEEGVRVSVAEPEASLRLLRAYKRLRAET